MNISVEEINIVNDGMYEIYTKFGMKIAIDVLKKRFSNITKEDTKTIKLLSCFVNYMKKKGVTVTNIKDLNDDTFKTYMDFVIEERSKKKEEPVLNTYIEKDNIIDEKQDINLDKTQVFSSKDIKEETKPKKESKIDALFKRKEKLENTGPIPVVKEDNKTGIIMGLEDKEKLLIDASLETFVKYNEIYSTKGNALGRKQLRTAILDKDNNFKYFTNGGEKMLREKLKESIKVDDIKVLVRNILLKNGFNAKNSNEEMCCEMFLTYIDNLSLEIENKNKKPLGR
ncbi:MAG: hypothetical protein BHW63_02925 [Mycoplasma sp. CAG:611_25_7]|nr:MAG: hypothetical protein BHW63_02925 [Mycoplasma sp. CAG:611_25_7]